MKSLYAFLGILALCGTAAGNPWEQALDIERAKCKQKQTVVEMRHVGQAFLRWLRDQNPDDAAAARPPVGENPETGWTVTKKSHGPWPYDFLISHRAVTEILVPDYIHEVPEKDAWGHPYQFALSEDLHGEHVVGIRSTGRDGRFEGNDYEVGGFLFEEFDRDLVWGDGYFIRWPESKLDRQKQTVSGMRNVGKAFLSWLDDWRENKAGASPRTAGEGQKVAWTIREKESGIKQSYSSISHAEVTELLVPEYIDAVPEKDGWGHPYQFALNEDLRGKYVVGIRSTGGDGRFEGNDYEVGGFLFEDSDRDLVWCDGYFARWPEAKKAGR